MKFKVTVIDPFADDINEGKTEVHFLRTLNTEKMFRDNTGAELQAQLSTLFKIQAAMEADPTSTEAVEARMDIEYSTTRHEVLKYMYAELKDGALIQNEETRKRFDEMEDLDENQALGTFFRNV